MNLCGGINAITEQDLLLELPFEDFSLTPKRRKPSSTSTSRPGNAVNERSGNPSPRSSSRGRDQMTVNQSTTIPAGSSATMLNPVSRDDMAKLRSRQQQQSYPMRGMKSSTILMKKLESGFNVVRSSAGCF